MKKGNLFIEKEEKVEIKTGKPMGLMDFMEESVRELLLNGSSDLLLFFLMLYFKN